MTVTIHRTTGISSPGGDTNVSTTSSGNQTAAALIPTGSTAPTNGVFLPALNTVGFATNLTERMRIDSSGNLLVGTTSASGAGGVTMYKNGSGSSGLVVASKVADGVTASGVAFVSGGTLVGHIDYNNTSTAYVTSSDYRLKENIQPMTNALGVVSQLNPVTYTWKSDGSDGQGFIAHELQAVVPDCVTGEKDAVRTVDVLDDEGKVIGTKEEPVYQGIDTSFLVATLCKAIQELTARVEQLEAK